MGKMENSIMLNSYIRRRKCNEKTEVCEKKKKQEALRRVSIILRKSETLRTAEENHFLESETDVVKQFLKRKNRLLQSKERILEKEDPADVIEEKARKLAEVISRARHLVCYTGAGISTSARIPDYRGSQGIWTLLQQGKDIGQHDLSLAEPTYTHMALYELHRRNILRYVLSQNCDGLHLRSGLPKKSLSEVHGNMYIEVCKYCKPNVEYWRLFDTTELTARYYHKTNRRCHLCGMPLVDTIVHFGERGSLKWPLNWDGAIQHADKADVILCIGSSLKVLKKYTWLWSMDRPKSKRPKIFIVNLQWTPKDATATMKINGKCDEVMKLVMKHMQIVVPDYDRRRDPIFAHSSLLAPEELHTRSQPMLQGHVELKMEAVTDDSNDAKSQTMRNGCGDGEEDGKPSLPDLSPILRNETNLMNGSKVSCGSHHPENERTMNLSCDRGGAVDDENECDGGGKINNDKVSEMDYPKIDEPESHTSTTNATTIVGESLNDRTNDDNDDDDDETNEHQASDPICDKFPSSLNPNDVPAAEGAENDENKSKLQLQLQVVDRHDRANNDCSISIKSPTSPTKFTSRTVCLFNADKDRYKHLIDLIYHHLPHWYDVNYAYSGLHSIIYPPPNEVDLGWDSDIIPLFQLNRSDAECDFCFDNYAEYNCQFYRPKTTDFVVTSCRNGRLIVCECCDYTGESDSENKVTTAFGGDAKRAKLDRSSNGDDIIKDDKDAVKIQAGWYGKGYRKMFRRKRRA